MITSSIQHIVAMPTDLDDEKISVFQGFSLEIYPEYAEILSTLAWFPHDLLECHLTDKQIIASKMAGSNLNIRMIRAELIDPHHAEITGYPTVIWSSSRSVALVEKRLSQFQFKPLHISLGMVSKTHLMPADSGRHATA